MKCPQCREQNRASAKRCAACGNNLGYLRDKIYLGQQFVLLDASAERPIALDLLAAGSNDEPTEHVFTEPAILSRHQWAVHFGKQAAVDETSSPRRRGEIWLPEELPALSVHKLDLLTVITDRKIYRPADEVYIFVAGPSMPGTRAGLELQLAGQQVYRAAVTLNDAGLCLHQFADLEEGEYRVLVTPRSRAGVTADCQFRCARFTLSPLLATLESHTIDRDQLCCSLSITQLHEPYTGELELVLRSGGREAGRQQAEADRGRLDASFQLGWAACQSLVLEITSPDGDTASVAFPSSSWQERQKIALSGLDPPFSASPAPFAGASGCARGLHYEIGGRQDTPFALEQLIADEGAIIVRGTARQVQLMLFDPMTGARQRLEYRDLDEGTRLTFAVGAPYRLFTLGAFMRRGRPFEAWGLVIRPEQLSGTLSAPQQAMPTDLIPIRIDSNRPAHCLLLVYDARLEHESPLPKLARRIFDQVRESTSMLGADSVAELRKARPSWDLWNDGSVLFSAGAAGVPFRRALGGMVVTRSAAVAEAAVDEQLDNTAGDEALAASGRERFPELAHIELFSLEGAVTRSVRLGDQIGNWRCRAYLFNGLDYVVLSEDVPAEMDLFAEIDVPAVVGNGDEVAGRVRYHAEDEATLTITTPGSTITRTVRGDGAVEVPLTAPGKVAAHIATGVRTDTSRREVSRPGVERVTASRLILLEPGQRARGRRVVAFPSAAPLLQETIEALIHYPYG